MARDSPCADINSLCCFRSSFLLERRRRFRERIDNLETSAKNKFCQRSEWHAGFLLAVIAFCAFAEAYWEEKNWWWDTLWEEEWLEEEPGEVSSGDPAAKKYSRIGFDATWQLAGLTLLCSGEDGLEAYPWQMRDNFHYQTLDLKTDFKLLNYHLLTWLDKQERRQFPYNPPGTITKRSGPWNMCCRQSGLLRWFGGWGRAIKPFRDKAATTPRAPAGEWKCGAKAKEAAGSSR